MRAGRERGSATVWVLALAGVLALIGLAGVLVGAAAVARHRAGSAADLTALAGAVRVVQGDPEACGGAGEVAAENGARLDRCAVEGDGVVEVTVSVSVHLGPVGERTATARARAGPVQGAP